MKNYHTIIDFWFNELSPSDWWKKDPELDQTISERFASLHQQAVEQRLPEWQDTAEGALAEIILLDQFSRNIFRDQPAAFAHDELALQLSRQAIAKGFNQELPPTKRGFLYLPFMHSESAEVHHEALHYFSEPGLENNLSFEKAHKAIIDRFGRYPHRNEILGRPSTPEELAFLQEPGSSF